MNLIFAETPKLTAPPIPSDAYLWLIAGFMVAALAISGCRNYMKNKTPVSKYSGIAWAILAGGLFMWSIPLLFTRDEGIITITIFIGTILYTFSFVAQAVVMWYLMFRDKLPLWIVLAPALAVWGVTQWQDTQNLLSDSLSYVEFNDTGIVLEQIPAIFLLLMIPILANGFYFFRVAGKVDAQYARIRGYLLGFIYILFGGQQIYTLLLDETSGSENTSRNIILLISILVVSLTFALSTFKHKQD